MHDAAKHILQNMASLSRQIDAADAEGRESEVQALSYRYADLEGNLTEYAENTDQVDEWLSEAGL